MKKILTAAVAALMASVLLAGCSAGEVGGTTSTPGTDGSMSSSDELKGKLVFAGSSSMTDINNALTEAFKKKNPGVTVEVEGKGSGTAIPALADGTAQIGSLSRDVKAEENAEGKYTAVTIALDGIAIVVNPANGVADLTKEQIAGIFTGEITNWNQVGGDDGAIMVLGREEGSGTRDGFEEIVGVKGKCQYNSLYGETGDVVSKVASEKAAIGYVSYASVKDSIKAVKVGGVSASESTIADKSYVIQRPFVYTYLKNTEDEVIKAYMEFVKSSEGQSLIKADKLVPQSF
ncbi:MAG: phosphate ABC transporter substrate-binding protein PstS family protein [Clostridiales bacterium]|jgi:phosphate transport system substrate-binding protein|nr:phosphate ABC transporter substrate-binding protein PstS family protein [Clostridiales bacterium]